MTEPEAPDPVPAPDSNAGTLSPDGMWRWDGTAWQPTGARLTGKAARAQARAAKAVRKAQRPWVLRHKVLTGLGAIILIVIIASIASTAGGSGKSVPAAADDTSTTGASPTASATVAPAAAQTLLSVTGNGAKQTQTFTAHGDWNIDYTYDCSSFGQPGNFAIMIYGSNSDLSLGNSGVNTLGMKGSDVAYEHHGGTYYLSVDSECTWTIKVTD